MYGGSDAKYAVCTEKGPESVVMEPFLQGSATE
jgi:hypothetical protein